jgi:ribosome-associated heat shock protein Hsp15
LLISKDHCYWEITVAALNEHRRSAVEAVLLYEESAESTVKRQQQAQQQREQRALLDFSPAAHKPNKKERRLIHRFVRAE